VRNEEIALQLLLHHEAGHVAACQLYDIPIDHVALTRGFWGRRAGYVQTTHAADPAKIEEEIIMAFSGLAAEEHWLGLHPGNGTVRTSNGDGDTALAHQLMREHETSSERHLRRRALAVMSHRWEHIEKIAVELGSRRRLTSEQAARAAR
jgi:hypothetical protein